MKLIWSEKYVVLTFIVVSVALRLFSFFPSVLDHDESTYLIIGRDILNGKKLYTDVTDTKPAGIFVFYAGMEFLFGSSIFLKRFAFALIVGFTAFLVFKISSQLFKIKNVAIASGMVYIFYTSIWIYHGRSPNTELLFNLTTIGALFLFFKPHLKSWFFGGILMGIGFMIKYLVVFDLAAFFLFFFLFDVMQNIKVLRRFNFWARYLLAGFSFLSVFGLVNLYFWMIDTAHEFFFVTYELPGNYGSNPSLKRYAIMLLDFIAKFLPISFFIIYVIIKKNLLVGKLKWFFIIWVSSILIAIYLPGKEFSHYTIQLMLPLSMLAGLFFHPDLKIDRYSSLLFSGKTGFVLLMTGTLTIQIISFNNEVLKRDYPREVAKRIQRELDQGEQIYVSNYEQIVYYLLSLDSPTKYVHPNLIFTETHKAFKINVEQELKRIMDTSPEFIITEKKNDRIVQHMKYRYQLMEEMDHGAILLFRLI